MNYTSMSRKRQFERMIRLIDEGSYQRDGSHCCSIRGKSRHVGVTYLESFLRVLGSCV